ncbi:hypothetical protein BGX38DRAFT_619371 [Terfezia claveryi]|nr:hypothetical protein BGX38DRAFT_619371 [Terfezia claveryi]
MPTLAVEPTGVVYRAESGLPVLIDGGTTLNVSMIAGAPVENLASTAGERLSVVGGMRTMVDATKWTMESEEDGRGEGPEGGGDMPKLNKGKGKEVTRGVEGEMRMKGDVAEPVLPMELTRARRGFGAARCWNSKGYGRRVKERSWSCGA